MLLARSSIRPSLASPRSSSRGAINSNRAVERAHKVSRRDTDEKAFSALGEQSERRDCNRIRDHRGRNFDRDCCRRKLYRHIAEQHFQQHFQPAEVGPGSKLYTRSAHGFPDFYGPKALSFEFHSSAFTREDALGHDRRYRPRSVKLPLRAAQSTTRPPRGLN